MSTRYSPDCLEDDGAGKYLWRHLGVIESYAERHTNAGPRNPLRHSRSILHMLEDLWAAGGELDAPASFVRCAADRREARKKSEDSPVVLAGLGSAFEYHNQDPKRLRRNSEGTKEYAGPATDSGARDSQSSIDGRFVNPAQGALAC